MVILDSNIFIYLANGSINPQIISNTDIAHSGITKIETLGYWNIRANELLLLEELFNESNNLPLTDNIVERAIRIRQAKSVSLGDAIIAATALETNLELWTVNTDDFEHIDNLKIFNPLKNT